MDKRYYVYILTNHRGTVLYTGVTGDLQTRIWQHREQMCDGLSKRYRTTKLVYYEEYADVDLATGREKEIKGWRHERKVELIRGMNREWRDLFPEP